MTQIITMTDKVSTEAVAYFSYYLFLNVTFKVNYADTHMCKHMYVSAYSIYNTCTNVHIIRYVWMQQEIIYYYVVKFFCAYIIHIRMHPHILYFIVRFSFIGTL